MLQHNKYFIPTRYDGEIHVHIPLKNKTLFKFTIIVIVKILLFLTHNIS